MTLVEVENFTTADIDALDPELVVKLQTIRYMAGVPIYVTSGFRPGDDKAHGRGLAVDISDNMAGQPLASGWRHAILAAIYALGLRRIGVYDRHIHFDVDPNLPQDVTWWATSD